MELHPGTAPDDLRPNWHQSLEDNYLRALHWCQRYMPQTLQHYRTLRPEHVTDDIFWKEYIWCVYTSGFNAKVVAKKIGTLHAAYGSWRDRFPEWDAIQGIVANRQKFDAIIKTASHIRKLGWESFQSRYLRYVDTIPNGCYYIGPTTKHHLARNIGLDTVKPDKHLVRLADHYAFLIGPRGMCGLLGTKFDERVGVVDFILWAYCAAYGTKELE